MNVLELHIHLETPLLLTGVANSEENSAISLPYIPGSAIRGACIAAYLRQTEPQDLLEDKTAQKLFFSESVCYLNGYPARPDTAIRCLPSPRSWHTPKMERDKDGRAIYDFAIHDDPSVVDNPKREQAPFYAPQTGEDFYYLVNPRRRSTVHNASDSPVHKAEGTSTLFRYEALEAGQTFIAYVISSDNQLLQEVATCFVDGRYYLGASKTAGYGRVNLTAQRNQQKVWTKASQAEVVRQDVDDYTVITLLSHAILQTKQGQPTTDFHRLLEEQLDKEINPPVAVFAQADLVGGYNRTWGLPLPQSTALIMGSTFVYKADHLPPTDLDALVLKGIGVRKNEGFGRIAVNAHELIEFKGNVAKPKPIPSVPLSADSKKLAQKMARRRLETAVTDAIATYVDSLHLDGKPENAQLSRLRLIVRQALRDRKLGLILTHLGQLKPTGQDQFRRRRISNLPREADDKSTLSWDQWLRRRAEKQDALRLIAVDPADDRYKIAAERVENQEHLAEIQLTATCLLIEAVLRHASRKES